jgi:outer membrane immunogenic protein
MKHSSLRYLIGSAAGIGLLVGTGAMAADLPVIPPPPPAFSWTGPYVGLHVGGAVAGTTTVNGTTPGGVPVNASFGRDGVFGGLHLGYNIQTGGFVIGLQAEYNFAGVTGSSAGGLGLGSQLSSSLRQFGSVDGRLGIAFDRWLVYAIGGFAYADQRHSITFNPAAANALSRDYGSNEYGWDVGGGVEYAFNNNWTGRVEYRYYNWGRKGFTDVLLNNAVGVPVVPYHTTTETLQTIRAGLTYRFNWPSAQVAVRY